MESIEQPFVMDDGSPQRVDGWGRVEIFGRLCGGLCGVVLLLLSMTVMRPLQLLERRRAREVAGGKR